MVWDFCTNSSLLDPNLAPQIYITKRIRGGCYRVKLKTRICFAFVGKLCLFEVFHGKFKSALPLPKLFFSELSIQAALTPL